MTSGERSPKSSSDDSSKKIVGYCDEGVKIRSVDGASTDKFVNHVDECSQCSVLLETEKPGGPIE